jgi:hypothetical protein
VTVGSLAVWVALVTAERSRLAMFDWSESEIFGMTGQDPLVGRVLGQQRRIAPKPAASGRRRLTGGQCPKWARISRLAGTKFDIAALQRGSAG